MKKIKVGLVGASGRMGQEISHLMDKASPYELFLPRGSKDKLDVPEAAQVDVWIDFSTPAVLVEVLKVAKKNKTPVVCGTTGLTDKEKKLLKKYSEHIPVLWASNMSLGVAVLNQALRAFAAIADFDFQVEEIHHKRKKDRPSGTAITIQENLEKVVGKKLPEALSIRGGGVFGEHKIFAMSDEEVITFSHSALSRTVFARGALKAAHWLVGKKPGMYSIQETLFGKNA